MSVALSLLFIAISFQIYQCRVGESVSDALREARSETASFRSHFPEENDLMLNYSVAALAAIKLAQRARHRNQEDKLPRELCPYKKYKCFHGKFRKSDGRCTNIFSPLSGSRYMPFSRRISPNYDDGISAPRTHGFHKLRLPSPELIKSKIPNIPVTEIPQLAETFVEFSEFLYNDLAQFHKHQDGIGCCGTDNGECLKIGMSVLDCYVRSAPSPLPFCAFGAREQMNTATSFIDAGPIYQNLDTKSISKGKISSLAFGSDSKSIVRDLFIDEHNWIVDQLKVTFPDLSEEIIFEEARKFVIAEIQHITFEHFLPILLGAETMDKYDLGAVHCDGGSCHKVEANTLNEYGSAVGLFHRFIETSRKSQLSNPFSFSDGFSSSSSLEISELIMRGRDHGIGTYAQWREECGGGSLESYEELMGQIDENYLKTVHGLFPEVRDVDLVLLGSMEQKVYGSLVGPTFGCILALQFQKAKFADSFWYTHILNNDQLGEINKVSISALMCRHKKTATVQKNAFSSPDNFQNIPIPCNSSVFATVNLSNWIQKEEGRQKNKMYDDILEECIQEVATRKRQTPSNYKEGLFNSVALKSYGSMMLAKDEAVNEANISFILLEATEKLVKLKNVDLSNVQGIYIGEDFSEKGDERCNPKPFPCDPTDPYRSFTGWCNNLELPSTANTFRELKRVLPPVYNDGISSPRSKSTSGSWLPSPRTVSNVVHHSKKIEHAKYSHFLMEFGQFIDHDITHSPVDQNPDGTPLNCSRCDSHQAVSSSCFPIPVPENDLVFESTSCLSFVRSLPAQKTLGFRNQMNQVSAYLDGSVMYGSTKCEGDRLRTFEDGKMKKIKISKARRHFGITLSQSDESEQDGCVSAPLAPCFIAGDDRNSQQTLLIAVHTVFHREHERVSTVFKEMNPHWEDEKIYQETRKLVSAQFTHIVYNEYLPIIIGQRIVDEHSLRPLPEGYYNGYENCDSSILQPFATAAFRFGHSTVTRFTPMRETFDIPATHVVDLASQFLNMSKIYNERSVEQILGGMHSKPQMMTDRFVDDAVRNFLFSDRGRRGTGLDLIAINIQRGRDHGIPPYNQFREYCGLARLTSFYSFFSDIDQDDLSAISQVYESPDDIDLFTGIVSEKTIPGAIVGPTAACIISEQFKRLKKCDRFYYENENEYTKFSAKQLKEIRKTTMSSLICVNTKLPKVAKDVFSVPDSYSNVLVNCDLHHKIDLSNWLDRESCVHKNKEIPLHSSREISPCTMCTCTREGVICRFKKPDCLASTKESLIEVHMRL